METHKGEKPVLSNAPVTLEGLKGMERRELWAGGQVSQGKFHRKAEAWVHVAEGTCGLDGQHSEWAEGAQQSFGGGTD